MDIERVKYVINEHLCDGITKDTMMIFLDHLNSRAKYGEKIIIEDKERCMKCRYAEFSTEVKPCSICYHAHVSKFEPKLKPKTRRQKIEDMLSCITIAGAGPDRMELYNLLIELRDEEVLYE